MRTARTLQRIAHNLPYLRHRECSSNCTHNIMVVLDCMFYTCMVCMPCLDARPSPSYLKTLSFTIVESRHKIARTGLAPCIPEPCFQSRCCCLLSFSNQVSTWQGLEHKAENDDIMALKQVFKLLPSPIKELCVVSLHCGLWS